LAQRKEVIGCATWDNEEKTAKFFEQDGMELAKKKTSARIDLPAVRAPDIAYSPQYAVKMNDEPPSISKTIRQQFSPTIEKDHAYGYSPKTNSTTATYFWFQEALATTSEHGFLCQDNERSSNSRIFGPLQ
jgi:hypothetical protein